MFPFLKFQNVDPILGPEMKSTGEVMGVGRSFAEAYYKSQLATGAVLPESGTAFISVRETDRAGAVEVARRLTELGFRIVATRGTAAAIQAAGIDCEVVNKVFEGRPHIVDKIIDGEIDLVVNTTEGTQSIADSFTIRREALQNKVVCTTTISGGLATCEAIRHRRERELNVYRLQDLHRETT